MKFVDNNFYSISRSKSSSNFLCEWDLVIKWDLINLRKNHPDIRLEIVDWTDSLLSADTFKDAAFDKLQQFTFMSNFARIYSHSLVEREMVDKGLKVGVIYGIDKPVVEFDDNNDFYMTFSDTATTMSMPRIYNPHGTEYFYWSPSLPHLPFEQAYQVLQHLNLRPMDRLIFKRTLDKSLLESLGGDLNRRERELFHAKFNDENNLIKSILYADYDPSLFQADKPMRSLDNFKGNTKDIVLETNDQILEVKKVWHGQWLSWLEQFKGKFQSPAGWFDQCRTKRFYVGKLT